MKKSTRGEMKISLGEPRRCACGKPMYDKKGAVTARNLRMRRDHVMLRVYECPVSRTWHLTKSV